jgi:hypothetical protein
MVFPEYASRFKKEMSSEREVMEGVAFVDDADFAVLDANGNVESYGRSEDFGNAVGTLAVRDRNTQNGHLLTDRRGKEEYEEEEYEDEDEDEGRVVSPKLFGNVNFLFGIGWWNNMISSPQIPNWCLSLMVTATEGQRL